MILDVRNISTVFHLRRADIHAVKDVSFQLFKGETLGIVGESGSGKTVLCQSLLGLLPKPPVKISGHAYFDNTDLLDCDSKKLRQIRGNQINMIFQDPSSAFNPYLKLSEQLIEPLISHGYKSRKDALIKARMILSETKIPQPQKRLYQYPHEFSGGMLQRAMIGMALITNPRIVIADEPTTALDVTVQARILQLMKRLQNQYSLSIIFITHNLGIVAGFCDRVVVMYAGVVLETASTADLFNHTAHPYTKALIKSVPSIDSSKDSLYMIPGMPPDPSVKLSGCPFAPRCGYRTDKCLKSENRICETGKNHFTSCIRVLESELSL